MDSNHEDHFDRLPDSILLLICNKLLDAKTLIRCLSVSKRFASLIPQIDTVFLPLPRVVRPGPIKPRVGLPKKVSRKFVQNLVTKLVRFLHHTISARRATNFKPNHFLYHSPYGVLKNFIEVKTLHLELPCIGCDMGFNDGDHPSRLLKWKAEFGEELKSCVILGATSLERKKLSLKNNGKEVLEEEQQEQECLQPYLAEEGLKSRIMWTISCLVSASVRHFLLKEIVAQCSMLQSVVITDASKQGKLCMAEEQLVELRNITMNSLGTLSERTPIPNSCMKLWYEPIMEFPASGIVMEGVTVVLIRPVNGGGTTGEGKSDGDLLVGDLDGEEDHKDKAVFGEAVREIVKRKTKLVLELSSF